MAKMFPKGEVDGNETYKIAAARETLEETGITLDAEKLEYLGQVVYKKQKKTIVLFTATVNDKDLPEKLHCSSTFQMKGVGPHLPEVDKYEWVTISDAIELVHEAQSRVIRNYVAENM